MKQLPISDVYEQEMLYIPYRKSLRKVLDIIVTQSPSDGSLLDLMCGPGFLLGQIAKKRSDLSLMGVDINREYIIHAKKNYPGIDYVIGNVLTWNPDTKFDTVICTGALHHIPYDKQGFMIQRMASMVKPKGLVIISDCYIDYYVNETVRMVAAAKLGYEYMRETIMNGAPREVVKATADILHNDVMMDEFKTSLNMRLPYVKNTFNKIEIIKTWPNIKSQYGDYILVCK